MKVGDFVVERLHAWGVRRIYGYPGDGINGVISDCSRMAVAARIRDLCEVHANWRGVVRVIWTMAAIFICVEHCPRSM